MTAKWAVLTGAITVDDTNKDIRVKANGLTETVSFLVNGTYYLSGTGNITEDILPWFEAMITTHTNITLVAASLSVNVSGVVGGITTTISSTAGADSEILWDDPLTTFDGALLGYSTSTPASTTHSSDISPKLLWVSNEPPFLDDRGPWESQSEQTITVDGKTRTFTRGTAHERRMLSFDFVSPHRTNKSAWGALNSNSAFESWWDNHRDGRKLRYYSAELSAGAVLVALSSSNFIGTYTLDESSVASWSPRRIQPGLELYGWSVGLRKYAT